MLTILPTSMTHLPDFHVSILLARRAKYLSACVWLVLITVVIALMASQFSGRQPATVAVDIGLSTLRLLMPFLIILLVQELLSKEFELRYFLTSLTYPRPRHDFLLGRLVAIVLLTNALLLVSGAALALLAHQIANAYVQATPVDLGATYWLTLAFTALDLFVITCMAVFISVVASTPSFVLIGTLGFMFVARSYSGILTLLEKQLVVDYQTLYKSSLGILHFIIPDLGALDIRVVSLYGKLDMLPSDWLASVASNIAYSVFLLMLSFFFLNRKQFS